MKTEFLTVPSYRTAKRCAPWAAIIHKVCGGWMAFESVDDFQTWLKQR